MFKIILIPKQIKGNVKAMQEKSDQKLKTLHQDMVVKKPAAAAASPKKPVEKKKKAAPVSAKSTRQKMGKLNV